MADVDPETLLEWLTIAPGDERDMQLIALEQLCMVLLMSDNVDRCFENCPPRSFLPALCNIFLDECAPDNVLEVTARALTYYLDVSAECTRRIVAMEGAVKAICNRLVVVEIDSRTSRDLAEQCIKVLELICTREAGAVFDAGGLTCVLSFIKDNGSSIHKDTLHSAMSVVSRLCSKVEPLDASLPICVQSLSTLLKHQDTHVADGALRCFASLSDRFTRRWLDPAPLAEHGLVNELLIRLSNAASPSITTTSNSNAANTSLNSSNSAMPESKASASVSTIISLLSTLCRGSSTITYSLLRSNLPDAIEKAMKGDERCILDCMRLMDLLLALLFEGRQSLSRNILSNTCAVTGTLPISMADEIYPRIRRNESNPDKSFRQLVDYIRCKDYDSLLEALDSGAVEVNYTDDVGQTLLNWAAAFGTNEMVDLLCERGADVNKGSRSSSLHYAACFGRPYIAKVLLKHGANPDLRDEDGKTALERARERCEPGNHEVAAILQSPEFVGEYLAPYDESERKLEDDHLEPKGDPEVAPLYLKRMLPVFCNTFHSTMLPTVRKASLSLIKKMIHYIQSPLLIEICSPESQTYNLGTMIVEVIATILDNEDDDEGHYVVLQIIQDLMVKATDIFLDHFARLGIFSKVQQFISQESERLSESATTVSARWLMDAAPSMKQDDAKEILPGIPYYWNEWSFCRGRDCLYAWNDYIALELCGSSNGWFRFVMDGKLSTMYSSGSPEGGSDATENKGEFIEKLQKARNSVRSQMVCFPVLSNPGANQIVVGKWALMCQKPCELCIYNRSGQHSGSGATAQVTKLGKDYPGFIFESIRGTQHTIMTDATLGPEFQSWVVIRKGKRMRTKTETVKMRSTNLASEIYDKYFVEAQAQPRGIVATLARIVSQIERACQKQHEVRVDDDNDRNRGNWKDILNSALGDLKKLLQQDGVLSSYEIHSSGLIQALLALLSNTIWDRDLTPSQRIRSQKQRIKIFRKCFKNETLENETVTSAGILVHKLISVLESIEKLPVYIYEPPGGAYGLQSLTRRLRFKLEKGGTDNTLVDRSGRGLKMEPLSTISQLERYLLKMVARQWYDNERPTFGFVRKVKEQPGKLTFTHQYDFDENGIIYWIGTNGRTHVDWVNPGHYGLVFITCSDGRHLPYGRLEDILSRDVSALNCHTNDDPKAWFVIDLGLYVIPTCYTLRHSRGYGKSALRNWIFQMSNDSSNWSSLYTHIDDTSLNEPGSTFTWSLGPFPNETKGWRYVRIIQNGKNASGQTHYLSLSGFEIYGTVTDVCDEISKPSKDLVEVSRRIKKASNKQALMSIDAGKNSRNTESKLVFRDLETINVEANNYFTRQINSHLPWEEEVNNVAVYRIPKSLSSALNQSSSSSKSHASSKTENKNAKNATVSTLLTNRKSSSAPTEKNSAESTAEPIIEISADKNKHVDQSADYEIVKVDDIDYDGTFIEYPAPVPTDSTKTSASESIKDLATIVEAFQNDEATSKARDSRIDAEVQKIATNRKALRDIGSSTYILYDHSQRHSSGGRVYSSTRRMKTQPTLNRYESSPLIKGLHSHLVPIEACEFVDRMRADELIINRANVIAEANASASNGTSSTTVTRLTPRRKGAIKLLSRLMDNEDKFRLKRHFSAADTANGNAPTSGAVTGSGNSSVPYNQIPLCPDEMSLEDFLESCRNPHLLAEFTNDEVVADLDDMDDEDDDDENEDDEEYEEMMTRNYLYPEDEMMDSRNIYYDVIKQNRRRYWDDEYVVKRKFSALIPAFDPRPGRANVNQTTDLEIPVPPSEEFDDFDYTYCEEDEYVPSLKLKLTLKAPSAIPGGSDVEIPLTESNCTIFHGIQELIHSSDAGTKQEKIRRIWDTVYTIVYEERKDEDVCNIDKDSVKCSRGSVVASSNGKQTIASCTVEDVLQLLRHLFVIYTRSSSTDILTHGDGNSNLLPAEDFTSKKVTNKLLQQIQDPLVLSSTALPAWCEELNQSCPFLFPFETRQLYFSCTSFGPSRSIIWLQTQRDAAAERQRLPVFALRRDESHEFRLGRLKHERIKVPRNANLLAWARQAMKIHADRKSILEVEFVGEQGTGLGPTLEFYALISAELQRRDLGIWLCDDDDVIVDDAANYAVDLGDGIRPPGFYVRRSSGLYPAPLPQDSEICNKAVKHFWFLGVLLAKVLQDNRLVDIPLSQPFLKLICQGDIHTNIHKKIGIPLSKQDTIVDEDAMTSSIISEDSERDVEPDSLKYAADDSTKPWFSGILNEDDLMEVDPIRGKFLKDLKNLVARKVKIYNDPSLSPEMKADRVRNLPVIFSDHSDIPLIFLDDLALNFTYLPSSKVFEFTSTNVVRNGSNIDVTIHNVEEYLFHTYRFILETGIRRQIEAFRDGFNKVFSMSKLSAFTPSELRLMLCGDQNPQWTREDIMNYTEPKLGYTKESPGFLRFVNVLVDMSPDERKSFLQFTTGCSSLPPGGIANLYPRLTVVRKVDAGEGSYPSVNTCVHYLKLPDYSTEEILRERLLTATREKGFHLN